MDLNLKKNLDNLYLIKDELSPKFFEEAKYLLKKLPCSGFLDNKSLIFINNVQYNIPTSSTDINFYGFVKKSSSGYSPYTGINKAIKKMIFTLICIY